MPTVHDVLATLVATDTTTAGSNLEAVGYVESLLDAHGVPHLRVPSPDGTKANLLARIGPEVEGGVVLTGHLDCVPVAGQPWSQDPFTLTEVGDRYVGRGTTDMKGFLAVVLAALPRLLAGGLRRPVLLALTYDEEIGTVGAPSAVEALLATQPRPTAVLVGEPTSMEVVTAHKGVRSFATRVDGIDGHSSQPQHAVNAVAALARIATFIADLAEEHREAGGDARFTPPETTFNLATITGGQAINIVPRLAELTWEYRPVPADDGDAIVRRVQAFVHREVLPRLTSTAGEGDVTFEPLAVARALAAEPDGAAEALARRLSGYEGPARTVPFATDGGHFQAAGLSTVVCGPGAIDQAHTADEWIAIEQLERCDVALERLVEELAG
ncbi:acetylornithine deacetylase [Nitriliruptoraceae bacterium ZYF776]|nr:acetylornithine deacetylase [Profundirhabdus halotolerans]